MELSRTLLAIPALNEEEGLPVVLAQAQRLGLAAVVLDGGSEDSTCDVARAFGVPLIHVPRGKGRAWRTFVTSVDLSPWDWVVMVDADGTYDLTALPRLLRPGTDMVVGVRVDSQRQTPQIRALGARLFSLVAQWLLGAPCPDLLSGFRVLRTARLREVDTTSDGFELEAELTMRYIQRGLVVGWEPVDYRRRLGRSKLNPVRDAARILRTMVRLRLEHL